MKKPFKKIRFGEDAQAILDSSLRVIAKYQRDGYTLSLRQLYYQLVAANIVRNTEQNYKRVGDVIANARMAGLAPWDMIEDRNRSTLRPNTWGTPGEIVRACAAGFRLDHWNNQPNYCEVMVEKQALEGVLEPVCNRLYVPFTSNKGYSSVSMMFEAGQRIQREFIFRCHLNDLMEDINPDVGDQRIAYFKAVKKLSEDGLLDNDHKVTPKGERAGVPRIVIFYLGDHDPSGIDMTRDVRDRLFTFSDCTPMEVRRLALNMEQIEELNPPENPAKMTDSRAAEYVAQFGQSSWELDAVEPEALANMVEEGVKELIDTDTWEAVEAKQNEGRESLKRAAARMDR